MFDLFVAVDLSRGCVVRLLRGDPSSATVYSEDPVAMAVSWERRGARWLHVVDLDAALGTPTPNTAIVREILNAASIPVQVAGGIRSQEEVAEWLDAGAARVVLGTRALDEAFLHEAVARHADAIVAAVDARAGMVQVAGWQASTAMTTGEVLSRLAGAGTHRILFTDIGRDGTLEGPNLPAIEDVLDSTTMGVIASGGVAALRDVEALLSLGHPRLEGVIVGRALYAGALRLEDALGKVVASSLPLPPAP